MRVFLLVLLLFTELHASAQKVISGQIIDKETNDPVSYAHLYINETFTGTAANLQGEFVIKIPVNEIPASLTISAVGYKTKRILVSDLSDQDLNILLEPHVTELREVMIKPIDPVLIMDSVLARMAINYDSENFSANGFQREYVKANGSYIQLLEVAFKTFGNSTQQQTEVLNAYFVEDKREKEALWNPSRGGFYTLGWTRISGIDVPTRNNFLGVSLKQNSDIHKFYDFELLNELTAEEGNVYVLTFDQKKGVKETLLKGTLYIDQQSYAISKLTYEISPAGINRLKSHVNWGGQVLSKPPKKIEVKGERGNITYKKAGEKWYLNSIIQDTEFKASLLLLGVTLSQKENLTFHSERIITEIDTISSNKALNANIRDIGKIPTLQNYIKKEFESYDVDEAIWSDINFIKSDTSFHEVARELNRKNENWYAVLRKHELSSEAFRSFSKKELREDVEFLQESLEALHPGYSWYTDASALDAQFDVVKKSLENNWTETDLLNELAPVIANINCGHTELIPSASRWEYQQFYAKWLPVMVDITGNRAIVAESFGPLTRGEELTAINSIPISSILKKLRDYIPTDGYNETYKDFKLQKEFSRLYSMYYPDADTFLLQVVKENKERVEHRLPGNDSQLRDTSSDLIRSFIIIDSLNTGYLRISSLGQSESFPGFLDSVFVQMNNNQIPNLILDLKENEGGADQIGSLVYSYLTTSPFEYYKRITLANNDSAMWNRLHFDDIPLLKALPNFNSSLNVDDKGEITYTNHINLGLQLPNDLAFVGSLYLIIDGGTFSAASELAAIIYSQQRAIIIGDETGGGYYGNCSLGTPTLTLPNTRLRVKIPLAKYELAVNRVSEFGRGVFPDNTFDMDDEILRYCISLTDNTDFSKDN